MGQTRKTNPDDSGSEPKALIVAFLESVILVLVPKKRGTGFQKVPLGHHYDEVAAFMITLGADIYGLDGHLEINFPPGVPGSPQRKKAEERFLDPISGFYGYPWREIQRGSGPSWKQDTPA